MQSLADMKHRNPMVISGDLHATGVGTMFGSGNRSFADNPITAVLCGPVSTAEWGFPSNVRGVAAALQPIWLFSSNFHLLRSMVSALSISSGIALRSSCSNGTSTHSPERHDSLEPCYAFAVERPRTSSLITVSTNGRAAQRRFLRNTLQSGQVMAGESRPLISW